MVSGSIIRNVPWVQVTLSKGQAIQTPFVILDTGFSGDVQVTPEMAQELGLETRGVTPVTIADGQTVTIPVALASVTMEGKTKSVEVLISGSFPLIGISFLSKFDYKAIVNCKNKTVALEKVF